MARIQKHIYLAFKIEGQKLKGENTNPSLHRFYHMLNNFKIQKGDMKIVVTDKDPAVIEQVDSTWVKGSIHLNMEILNFPAPENMICGLDHSTEALILNELLKLKIDEGKYTRHVKIEVLEVTFTQSQKRYPHVWPSNEIPVVGF
ncbi:MAG: hypothetical protein E3J56_02050 [Candidatus Aminicenantes bacterium]|nr:MAG: hypothetical protein E3J56_02050 [Candidatus Aminicenantes bacterium]